MKIFREVLVIFGLYYVGELISTTLSLPLPGSLVGMILLFVLLQLHIVELEQIATVSDFLLGHLPSCRCGADGQLFCDEGLMDLDDGHLSCDNDHHDGLQRAYHPAYDGKEIKAMKELLKNPMFGILLSLAAFEAGLLLQKKTKLIFLNPLLTAIMMVIAVLMLSGIGLETYQLGGDIISLFLGPATVVLAVPLYQQVHSLKNYFVPIMVGIVCGIAVGLVSTLLCAWLVQMEPAIIASLVPKSITTPIGMELSVELGGIQAITVLAILVTGIIGAVVAEFVFRVFRIEHPIARGIALGCSAHAIGTSKALQLGHVEGAMSSLAIGVCGILTVFLAPPVWSLVSALL